jgi:gluconolactonase
VKRLSGCLITAALLLGSCSSSSTPSVSTEKAATAPTPSVPNVEAELLGSSPTWGNTEGPAVDSKGTLYFTSRGTYKGIVSWNEKQGFKEYLAVATKEGPGGLWVDDADNIFVTATGERQILKITPDKKVSVVAQKFEADPKTSKGPNDLVVMKSGVIYFTAPNGYDGSAPNGTIYRIDKTGKTTVFSSEITGPNGIALDREEKTLYVSHNPDKESSRIVKWPLKEDGTAGPMSEVAKVQPCGADGMALDKEGALWLTCYSFGTAYRISPEGKTLGTVTTAQKALTNVKFGRAGAENTLYFTSSDMTRITGYVYRAKVSVPGTR